MIVQKKWDQYEAAILLEAALNVNNKVESRNAAIKRVSDELRTMAINRGFTIDDIYRNTNGISLQLACMTATFFNIDSHMNSHSKLFCEISDLYRTNQQEYKNILLQAKKWIRNTSGGKATMCNENNNRDLFSSWIKNKNNKKIVPNLVLMAFDDVSEYAVHHHISKESIWDITEVDQFNTIRMKVQSTRLFRLSHKKSAIIFDNTWKYYIEFLKNRTVTPPIDEPIQKRLIISDNISKEKESKTVALALGIDNFYNWMVHGGTISQSSCRQYASALKVVSEFAVTNGIVPKVLYEIPDNAAVEKYISMIIENPEFHSYNAKQHNRFSAVLNRYLEYRTGTSSHTHKETIKPVKITPARPYNEQVSAVLKEHFQNGFRLESTIDINRFRRFAKESETNLPESDEILKSIIKNIGIKIDDKVYLITSEVFNFIKNTIQLFSENQAQIVFYECLYNSNFEAMEQHCILSPEFLKSILKKCYLDIFDDSTNIYFAQNFISLIGKQMERDAVTLEMQRVWGESQIKSVQELAEKLPAIPEDYIRRYLSGNISFVWVSEDVYFNLQNFIISQDEKDSILNFVECECTAKGYASVSDLPEGNSKEENYELSESGLQEALYKKVLGDKYYLNGKIITKENNNLNVVLLIKKYLENKDNCTFDEVNNKVTELTGGKYRYMAFEALYSSMVRIDKNNYVASKYLNFDTDAIDKILSAMIKDQFIAIKEITSFAMFPICGFPWNHYLLESYCYSYSKKFCLRVLGFNDKNVGIIASKETIDEYNELLAYAAAKAKIELTPDIVGQYYFETGYMGKRKFSELDAIVERAKAIREDM